VPPETDRIQLGKRGEELACRELTRRGYAILARRYRTRFGEIDIVCRDGRALVFVEVKARQSRRYGSAIEAVTNRKQRRVAAMALDYLARAGLLDAPCRFDVVSIDGLGTDRPEIRVTEDAFSAISR
jgi:putative endonuclease